MTGGGFRIAAALLLALTAATPALAQQTENGATIEPESRTAEDVEQERDLAAEIDGFVEKSAKYCASGYAVGAAAAMVAGLVGAGIPLTFGAVTGTAAVGCGVAWVGSTAADGFFWARDRGAAFYLRWQADE